MSSSGLDPNVPLPPVDEDSDLVGENNKRRDPRRRPDRRRSPCWGDAADAGGWRLPSCRFRWQPGEGAGGDDESDDDE